MAQTTPKLGLTKPELSDLITDTIPAMAQNMQDIDDKVAPLSGATFTGNVALDGGSGFLEAIVKRLVGGDTVEGAINVQLGTQVRFLRRVNGATTAALEFGNASAVRVSKRGAPTTLLDIAEYGSNTNGEYVRFYNGLQVCWKPSAAAFASGDATWTFPVPFSTPPFAGGIGRRGDSTTVAVGLNGTATSTSATFSRSGSATIDAFAVGTWY